MSRRVPVNLTWIAPGRVGGSEEYLVRQLMGFTDDEFEPEVICTNAFAAAHPDLVTRFPTRISPVGRDYRGVRIGLEHTWLAGLTRGADLVHHGGGTAPLIGRRPYVLTVHDLQYLEFPQYFSPTRRRYLDAMMPPSVRRAAVVATPSEFVRRTVIDAFDVDPARVVVVPHGIPELAVSATQVADARRRHRVDRRPYVVYPAITHPHKGHLVLADMLDRLDGVDLVLVGGAGSADERLNEVIGGSERVIRTGRVSAADRDALVAGSDALVFPSEYEGFGAPLVEAMALGVPVVGSDAAAVCEVVDGAGIIVAERSGAAWAAAVDEARSRREELVERGRRRSAAFDLATSGRALAAAYRLAIERGRSQ